VGNTFGFYKSGHILLYDSANCAVLRAVVLTTPACDGRTDRQTDSQTDGNAIASTEQAMRVLRRAVKTVSGNVVANVAQSIINRLSSSVNMLAGGRPLPPKFCFKFTYPLLIAASLDTFCLVAPQR